MRRKKVLASRNIACSSMNKGRRIMASTYPEDVHPALAEFDNQAYHAGYDVSVSGDSIENAIITLKAKSDVSMMPKLTVWLDTSDMKSKRFVYFQCRATFPAIDTRELDFHDSAEYWADKWKQVTQFITWMMDNTIDLDAWEED